MPILGNCLQDFSNRSIRRSGPTFSNTFRLILRITSLAIALHSTHTLRTSDNLALNDRNHTLRSFMSSVESLSDPQLAAVTRSRNVVLSPYVNERFPAWEDLLSAHHVSRLTRRPRWALAAMALLGQFPTPARFRGRAIGWHRGDVARWIGKRSAAPPLPCACGAVKRPIGQLPLFRCLSGQAGSRPAQPCGTFPGTPRKTRRHGP
jgi:predicted DNA-binding transcriptional regulator AlpA